MPIAIDMKNITEGIEISYGDRVVFLSDLFKETNETLKTFHQKHQKMSTDLWNFLTSDRDNRKKAVVVLRGKNKRELKTMAKQLSNNLRESVSSMKKDTAELMTRIREDINSMEKEIKNELVSATRGRIEQVKKRLVVFFSEHEARSRQLRHQLSTFQKELESTVKETRIPVIKDIKEDRQNWHNLVRIMAAKRTGKTVTVAKKIEGVVKKEAAEAVKAFTAESFKEQILRLISEAASGITLSKMGKALGVQYIRLTKPASELITEGKIKKEGSGYFKV